MGKNILHKDIRRFLNYVNSLCAMWITQSTEINGTSQSEILIHLENP